MENSDLDLRLSELSLSLAEKEAQAFHKEAEIIRIKMKILKNKGDSESLPVPVSPRPVGEKKKVNRDDTFKTFKEDDTIIQHVYKGYTAYAKYVGNQQFMYCPYGDSTEYSFKSKISGFPKEHVKYLLDSGKIVTGSLNWNGWDVCSLKGGKKGKW